MNLLIPIGSAAFCIAAIAQIASIVLAISRFHRRDKLAVDDAVSVSILRPVCGIDNFVEETLRSTFHLDYPHYEIVFCVADGKDPVIPVVQRLISAYPDIEARLLIGNTAVSANPKLNNLVKGWHAARYEWVLMADSNVLMPKDHLQRMLSVWRPDTGLVCSPPIGSAPQSVWAELECAFLNTYQARWQYFADSIGLGFAQGKAMLWRRDLLELGRRHRSARQRNRRRRGCNEGHPGTRSARTPRRPSVRAAARPSQRGRRLASPTPLGTAPAHHIQAIFYSRIIRRNCSATCCGSRARCRDRLADDRHARAICGYVVCR